MFCGNRVIITYWLKKGKKLYVSETLIVWSHTVPVNHKKFSSNTIFRLYTSEKFYMVKFSYFSRLTTIWVIFEIKILLLRNKKYLYVTHPISTIPWFIKYRYCHRFLFSSKMGNIRSCKEVRLQKPIKFRLSRKYSLWHFCSCLKMKNHLGRVSPYYFLQNVLIETLNVCFENF